MPEVTVDKQQLDDLIASKNALKSENEALRKLVVEKQTRINEVENLLVDFLEEVTKLKDKFSNKKGNSLNFGQIVKSIYKLKSAENPIAVVNELGFGGIMNLANNIVEVVKPNQLALSNNETKALENGKKV